MEELQAHYIMGFIIHEAHISLDSDDVIWLKNVIIKSCIKKIKK